MALVPDSPIPSISETVDRFPWFGWMVLGALAHHWYLEAADAVVEAIEDAVEIFEKERSA